MNINDINGGSIMVGIMISILILAVSVAAVFIHGTLVEVAKVLYAIYSVLQDINGKIPDREELRKGSF